jgi:hypothetical protein
MKELARSRETDTFDWEVVVTVNEDDAAPSLWHLKIDMPEEAVRLPRLTRGQVRMLCDALRRALVVASVKVNPLDEWKEEDR